MEISLIFDKYDDNTAVVNITAPTKKATEELIRFLYRKLTFVNEKVKYSWEFEQGFSDANDHIFDKKTQTLPIGLIPKTVKYLKEERADVKVGVSNKIREIYSNPKGTLDKEVIKKFHKTLDIHNIETGKRLTPYDHQIDLFERAINGRRISLLACTSSGKSLSIYALARYLKEVEKKKVLIITPSSGLVVQLFSDFKKEYGWKEVEDECTLIYGKSKDKLTVKQKKKLDELNLGEEVMLKDVVISTWQSLQNKLPVPCPKCKKLKKKRPLECPDCDDIKRKSKSFFNSFSAVVVDEAHSTRGEVLRDILGSCVNATDFKIGVSGTLPDEGLDAAWIEGSIGRKEVVVKTYELIEKGILPPLEIHSFRVPYELARRKYLCRQNFRDEYFLISNNGSRKEVMSLLLKSARISTNENTLMLYKNKATLDEMYEYLSEKFPQYTFHVIKGEISEKAREEIRAILETGTGHMIIATYGTMKQGVNIPNLHNLVYGEFSKSPYEIVQSIGRVARPHPSKTVSRIFDIFDDCSYYTQPRNKSRPPTLKENYSVKHYNTRKQYYEDEKFPITEFSLEGIYEATVFPDDLVNRKEAAKKKAAKSKTKSKTAVGRKKLGNKSQFV